jgi:hypothetical protein
LQLWTPNGEKQAGHGDIPADAWTGWLRHILNPDVTQARGANDALTAAQSLLFFFSNPAIDEKSESRLKLFTSPETEIELKKWNHAFYAPTSGGGDGWIVVGCPLASMPVTASLIVRLRLTAGIWHNTETFPVNYQGGRGSGDLTIGGTGESQDHESFITVISDEKYGVPQWDMLAKLPDDTVVGPKSINAFYGDGRGVHTVRFAQPLSALAGFFLRSRQSKATEFKDVKVPPLADAGQ